MLQWKFTTYTYKEELLLTDTTLTSEYLHHNGMSNVKICPASQTTFINIYKNATRKLLLCNASIYFTKWYKVIYLTIFFRHIISLMTAPCKWAETCCSKTWQHIKELQLTATILIPIYLHHNRMSQLKQKVSAHDQLKFSLDSILQNDVLGIFTNILLA
jgi:hypothetical protein